MFKICQKCRGDDLASLDQSAGVSGQDFGFWDVKQSPHFPLVGHGSIKQVVVDLLSLGLELSDLLDRADTLRKKVVIVCDVVLIDLSDRSIKLF